MKTFFKLAIVAILAISSVTYAQAQKAKFAHINSNELLMVMPERSEAEKAIQAEAKKLESQLQAMSTEYQNKVAEYQAEAATMSKLIQETKAKEIADLEMRIQNFQMNAQEDLSQKEQELLQPLISKAKKAIKDVADENGYAYVFDTSTGAVIHFPEGDDILPLVKKKMGITTAE